jgi:hypothetical protein
VNSLLVELQREREGGGSRERERGEKEREEGNGNCYSVFVWDNLIIINWEGGLNGTNDG